MVDIVAFPSPISDKFVVINSQNFFSNEWARYASIAATGAAAIPAVKAPAITVGTTMSLPHAPVRVQCRNKE